MSKKFDPIILFAGIGIAAYGLYKAFKNNEGNNKPLLPNSLQPEDSTSYSSYDEKQFPIYYGNWGKPNEIVLELQKKINSLVEKGKFGGWNEILKEDGIFGNRTKAALDHVFGTLIIPYQSGVIEKIHYNALKSIT